MKPKLKLKNLVPVEGMSSKDLKDPKFEIDINSEKLFRVFSLETETNVKRTTDTRPFFALFGTEHSDCDLVWKSARKLTKLTFDSVTGDDLRAYELPSRRVFTWEDRVSRRIRSEYFRNFSANRADTVGCPNRTI